MFKKIKIVILFFLIIYTHNLYAHTEHYDNLKKIEFDIYRNDKYIGQHVFLFDKKDQYLEVRSEIDFKIKKLGVTLYKYHAIGTEFYQNGELVKFNSKTNQNGKNKYVNMNLENNKYKIDGSSYKGFAPSDFVIGTWWNHSIIDAKAQISAVSGRIIEQKVTFLGNETIKFDKNSYNSLHFNFSSVDKKLSKGKKLNTDVWYDEEKMIWVKASFNKSGRWEYRLRKIEYF